VSGLLRYTEEAWVELALNVSRIITPTMGLVPFATFWTLTTRATIEPSPDMGWYKKWKPSAVP
jgi:hypothetical protein